MKLYKNIKMEIKKKKGKKLAVYLIFRILILITLVRQLMLGNIPNAILCISSLILFLIPSFLDYKFKIVFPDALEIIIYLFIFSSYILGEINEFYINIKNFDSILHTINGFIMAGMGFSLANIFNNSKRIKVPLKPIYVVLCGFCFSMTTGVIWEIFEYSVDKIFSSDMQKDTVITEITSVKFNTEGENKSVTIPIESLVVNGEDYMEKYGGYIDIGLNDTMEDLIVNFIGAIVFSILGYSYLKGKGSGASNFIVTLREE